MKIYKIFALFILMFSISLTAAEAQTGKKKTVKKVRTPVVKTSMKPVAKSSAAADGSKILVEGSQSKVETPFIFVARDAETYALMRSLAEGLPESSTIDFGKSAVVAAFAGEKNTGGWTVKIQQSAGRTTVELNAPPKGSMTTQVITYPFQVVSIPADENQALDIQASPIWTNQMQTFQVSKSSFEYSGGIAGKGLKFGAEGSVGVLAFGDHLTYLFNLKGKGAGGGRSLSETASGVIANGAVNFARLDAGSFADNPHPALKVTGTATDKKIMLSFDSLPPTIADGYTARGTLEAVRK